MSIKNQRNQLHKFYRRLSPTFRLPLRNIQQTKIIQNLLGCYAGISGDMTAAALLDLGVPLRTRRLLVHFMDRCNTITFDNSKEFAEHERIDAELQTLIYFAHPYHSWKRGLNENSKGLLRQTSPRAWSWQTSLKSKCNGQ